MDYEKEMRSCKQPSTNDLKMPGETEVAETQRLANKSAEEVQCACAFESSKDVLDNDIVVDEVDERHTRSEIDDSEVLQEIFFEYPFHICLGYEEVKSSHNACYPGWRYNKIGSF
nr:hypothetical protein [Tanacetum cinerariifolium]